MFTAGHLFVAAVLAGLFGIGLGILIVATYRSRPVEELADPAYNPTLDGAYDVFEGGDDD